MDMSSHMVSSSRLDFKEIRSRVGSLVSRTTDPASQSPLTNATTVDDSEQERTIDDLRNELNTLLGLYTTEVQENNSKDIQIRQLNEDNGILTQNGSAESARTASLKERFHHLSDENRALRDATYALHAQTAQLEKENNALIDANRTVGAEFDQLQRKHSALQQDALVACDYSNTLRRRNERLISESVEWKEQNECLKARVAEAVGEADRAMERSKELTLENKEFTAQNEELAAENEKLEGRIDDLYFGCSMAVGENDFQVRALTGRNESLLEEVRGLRLQLAESDRREQALKVDALSVEFGNWSIG
ncbi:MAG: hypothetical protein LQ350_008137 [Teloschistes chrysophthalmus]|nr:MAG: hypothetical protein LQ350_008137 [Niorma chrysophthalma]